MGKEPFFLKKMANCVKANFSSLYFPQRKSLQEDTGKKLYRNDHGMMTPVSGRM